MQMTTAPGDIVLYSGDQLVLFFGSNSWSYTKLGHIDSLTTEELTGLLSGSSAEVEISRTESIIAQENGGRVLAPDRCFPVIAGEGA